ncbi:signal recognition particle-docking protein FtsY [Psychrobium sp. 1_MG-2023]|uniref:signal recognition particle-docking protein FtsY n=1 Tax=Psychrobium sp. 1_MG-2023 TaxID=3062624 RepID=UPI000C32178C|nr:signal recognition particle-docking protein FtsY [Psychrobium sp. 1_MG-2023]MDP2561066.1 signal recognition particle-docking protein FtsY [Psychrobium sp. 1_MG-2023]PKF58356.1 signal recognition particle-docking protein FtsY [Alteromonadales bacterium alter-6D02]
MAKKGMFGWLKFGRNKEKDQQEEAERLAAEQAEAERVAAEQAEAERVAAEQAEAERVAAEQAEAERVAAEQAEAERVAAEQAQAERVAAEQAEAERVAAEQAEAERVAAEQAEAERVAAEQAQAERVAAEQAEAERVAAEQAEAERVAAEQAEAERVAAEQAEAERVAAEQAEAERVAAEQAEAERVAAEQAEAERVAAEQAEAERVAAEQAEAERVAAEQAEAERVAAEQAEAERVAAEEAEAERVAAEEAEAERVAAEQAEAERVAAEQEQQPEKPKKAGFFARLKEGLKRTKQNFGSGFFSLFKGKKIDDELFEELEEQLLVADVGVDTTLKIIDSLTDSASRKQLNDGEALYQLLQDELSTIVDPVSQPLDIEKSDGPYVILMVGVNGVGKTTTIGKLAKKFQQQGKKVALAAGDTFRAAAVEQLQVWGERNDIPVIAQHTGADSASVIFDAVQAAKARNVDVLIADTAGRLQNKAHLMEELKKVVRVMKKLDDTAPHEVMLTLDAGTGQNAMSQVELFHEAVGVTGLTLTKLDGTAKGGVIFALADKYGIPIRYIGVGEGIDDLREFDSKEFIEALFVKDE